MMYIFSVLIRLVWLPFHSIGYVFGNGTVVYNYNYYSAKDFEEVMTKAVDGKGNVPNYFQYCAQAKKTISRFIGRNSEAIVFRVNSKDMLEWLETNKLLNIHANRIKYAGYLRNLSRTNGVVVEKNMLPILVH